MAGVRRYKSMGKILLAFVGLSFTCRWYYGDVPDDLSYLDMPPPLGRAHNYIADRRGKTLTENLRHIRLYDLSAPLTEEVNETIATCIPSSTNTSFPICLYPEMEDKFISAALLADGIWEPYLTRILESVLKLYPESTVLDIGANIGYFSFLAAANGHRVIAVEPYMSNVQHFHVAVRLSNFSEQILLARNVMSHRHDSVTLCDNDDNKGGITVLLPGQPNERASTGENRNVPTVVLDDMLQLVSKGTVIIKIDVEGYECRAMARSRRFLSRLRVPYIFMEWQRMYAQKYTLYTACTARAMEQLTRFLVGLGYRPHEIRSHSPLSPDGCISEWKFGDVFWRHKTAKIIPVPN